MLGITGVTLWQLRQSAEANAEASITKLDRVLAEQGQRAFQAVDLVVSGIVDELKAEGISSSQELRRRKSGPEIYQALRQKLAGVSQAEVLSLIDAEGNVINFSRSYPAPPLNVADRDYFVALRDHPELQLFISKPVQNRVTGAYTIFLARHVAAPGGAFIGIVLGAIELKYFEDFYHDVNPGEGGSIALWRNDGTLLVRDPVVADTVGRPFTASPFFEALVASNRESGLTRIVGAIQGGPRIIAVRRLREFPLIATVGLSRDAFLAPWRSQAIVLGAGGVIASLAVALITLLVLRQFAFYELMARQRAQIDFETEARHRLELALESEKAALREYERAEQALRRSQEHLDRAQRIAGIGSSERDYVSGRTEWSDECYRIYGVDRGSFEPRPENLYALVHPEDRARLLESIKNLESGVHQPPIEYRIIRPDGELRYLSREQEAFFDDTCTPPRLVRTMSTIRDVTELRASQQRERELERQLLHSQKLEALGTLAGGMAHDLNNALMPILALSKVVMEEMPEGSNGREDIETIVRSSERARDLVRRILAFSRKQEMVKGKVDLAVVTREALRMLRATLPATVQLVEDIGEVPPLLGDPGQLQQVIVNLVTNAVQAIGNRSGKITVAVSPSAELLPSACPEGEAGAIRLSVADTGSGMDEATLNRIFEPFFTTKNVGEGTGLGLSVAHGIVTGHGGRIDVRSARGAGTEFTVLLPAWDEDEAALPIDRAIA